MKYIGCLIMTVLALLLVSFTSGGKRRKATLPPKSHFGHIQWIRAVSYKATMDSTGSILKGGIVSDTDEQGMDGGAIPSVGEPMQTWTYDEYGDQLEHDKYHANGKIYSKETHEYYPNGDMKEVIDSSNYPVTSGKISEFTYKYDNSGNLLDSTVCAWYNSALDYCIKKTDVYDPSGKRLEEYRFYMDTIHPRSLILYRYNEKGQLAETDDSKITDRGRNDLTPTEKHIFWYDNEGKMIDEATYRFHEGLIKDVKMSFDTSGFREKIFTYGPRKVVKEAVIKSFFKADNTVQKDTYDADGSLTDYTISHLDSAGNVMDKGVFHVSYHNTKGDTVMVQHLINDNQYNVVEDDKFSDDGESISHKAYQYTYDSIGNWIEKIEFDNNQPVKIIDREIGYFKD